MRQHLPLLRISLVMSFNPFYLTTVEHEYCNNYETLIYIRMYTYKLNEGPRVIIHCQLVIETYQAQSIALGTGADGKMGKRS